MRFPTTGVLSLTTGLLMGEIGEVYAIASWLVGRPIFTHELPLYGERMKAILLTVHPELPSTATTEAWTEVRDEHVARLGATIELAPELEGCLADGKDALRTLREMGFEGKIVVLDDPGEGGAA